MRLRLPIAFVRSRDHALRYCFRTAPVRGQGRAKMQSLPCQPHRRRYAKYFRLAIFRPNGIGGSQSALEDIGKFQPNVSDNISLGTDIRTLYIYDENASQSSFFQMEGNSLSQRPDQRPLFDGDSSKGLYAGFDVYGLGYYLPIRGVCQGRQVSAIVRLALRRPHQFRSRENALAPKLHDTGVEFGFYPESEYRLNSACSTAPPANSIMIRAKPWRPGLEFRKHIGFLGVGLGGSFWRNDRTSGSHNMYGPFGYLTAFKGRLIYLVEKLIGWKSRRMILRHLLRPGSFRASHARGSGLRPNMISTIPISI